MVALADTIFLPTIYFGVSHRSICYILGCGCRYTVLFAVARTVGWVAQWKEMAEEPLQKISRPRQVSCAAGLCWHKDPFPEDPFLCLEGLHVEQPKLLEQSF